MCRVLLPVLQLPALAGGPEAGAWLSAVPSEPFSVYPMPPLLGLLGVIDAIKARSVSAASAPSLWPLRLLLRLPGTCSTTPIVRFRRPHMQACRIGRCRVRGVAAQRKTDNRTAQCQLQEGAPKKLRQDPGRVETGAKVTWGVTETEGQKMVSIENITRTRQRRTTRPGKINSGTSQALQRSTGLLAVASFVLDGHTWAPCMREFRVVM